MKLIPSLVLAAASLVSLSASALSMADRYGSAANATAAARVIDVTAATRFVNVNHGDTVTFTNGSDTVSWTFDGVAQAVPLSAILPHAGAAAGVLVYVTPEAQS